MNTDICLIRLGGTNIIPVLDPTIAREILKKQDAIFADRPVKDLGSHIISGGYLTTAVVPCNSQWWKMRKVMTNEIVSPARLKWLHDKRAEEADNLVFYVHNRHKAGECVNLRTATQHYSGNVIRRMLFGKRFFGEGTMDGGPGKEEVEHVKAAFTVLKYLYAFSISDYLPCLRWLDVDGHGKIVKDANKEIMIAGLDNPSNAVEWTMAELINQPNLLEKATKEIDRVVGKDRLVQETDIESLNYVKACAREAFRLHPMLPFNAPHVATQDTTVAGYFIPKGSHALLSRYGLGRNPKAWNDPLKFDPTRHLHDGGSINLSEPDLRFISFSTGRRACVAPLLGTCMTIMLLARLLQCFKWTPPGNTKTVDLTEAEDELVLATPLTVFPAPRLAPHLYPTICGKK
ncbi:Valine N-monooxygenase 1 [Linum perenne]